MTTVLKMSLLADNTTDVNALMQTVLASNKSQAITSETATIVQQPTAFETLRVECRKNLEAHLYVISWGFLVYSFNFERGLSKDKLAMKKEYLKPENCPRAFNVVIVCITESV